MLDLASFLCNPRKMSRDKSFFSQLLVVVMSVDWGGKKMCKIAVTEQHREYMRDGFFLPLKADELMRSSTRSMASWKSIPRKTQKWGVTKEKSDRPTGAR